MRNRISTLAYKAFLVILNQKKFNAYETILNHLTSVRKFSDHYDQYVDLDIALYLSAWNNQNVKFLLLFEKYALSSKATIELQKMVLDDALRKGEINLAKALIEATKRNSRNIDLYKYLRIAITMPYSSKIINFLVEYYNVDVNHIYIDRDLDLETSETLLHIAITFNRFDSVVALLEKGADIKAVNSNGDTPLVQSLKTMCIVSSSSPALQRLKIIEALIQHGANVNNTVFGTTTLLRYSMDINNIEIVKLLLKYGADCNALDEKGHTAVEVALHNAQNADRAFGGITTSRRIYELVKQHEEKLNEVVPGF